MFKYVKSKSDKKWFEICRGAIKSKRCVAILFITGSLAGCSPSITSDDWTKRMEAVSNINDQDVLARIALDENQLTKVRTAAIYKLTDQMVLLKVVETSDDPDVSTMAVRKLTDQTVLVRLATEYRKGGGDTQKAAIEKVTDQALLANIVESAPYDYLRMAAAGSLTDKAILTKLLQNRKDHIDQIANLRLFQTDPAVIQEVGATTLYTARETFQKGVDWKPGPPGYIEVYPTIGPFNGEKVTFTVSGGIFAFSWKNSWMTDFIHGEFSDKYMSAAVDIHELATKLLQDLSQIELSWLSQNSTNLVVQYAVAASLAHQAWLAKLATSDKLDGRMNAAENLTDQTLLAKLISEDTNYAVRVDAKARLEYLRYRLEKLHKAGSK